MKKIVMLLASVLILLGFFSCNKDDYGKERDELLNNIELTEIEQLKGISYWGKNWRMVSMEYNGEEYFPDMTVYPSHTLDGTVIIPEIKTKYFDGNDSIEIDSIYHRIGGGSLFFFVDNYEGNNENRITISIDLLTYQLQDISEYGYISYEVIKAFPDLHATWCYNENTNDLLVKDAVTSHFGIFESYRNLFYSGVDDTSYSDFNIQILELSEENIKFQWCDPTMDMDYIVNMVERKPEE